jgi:hypothetical protein
MSSLWIESIADVVAAAGVVTRPQYGPLLKRDILGDAMPMPKNELVAFERPVGTNLPLRRPKHDRITTIAALFARHSLHRR